MKPAPVVDSSKPPQNPADMLQVVSRDVMKVGTIRIDLKAGTAEIPAVVAHPYGPLEYVIVAPSGKAYESLLTVGSTAVELRFALTLLGFEGTRPDAQGKVAAPTAADTVMATVQIGDKTRPLADLMIDQRTHKPVKNAPWQVIGFSDADRDEALRTEQLMTLVPREVLAPLRYTFDAGNPYVQGQGLVGNAALLPPSGTSVTLVLARRPDAPALSPGRAP